MRIAIRWFPLPFNIPSFGIPDIRGTTAPRSVEHNHKVCEFIDFVILSPWLSLFNFYQFPPENPLLYPEISSAWFPLPFNIPSKGIPFDLITRACPV